LGTDDGSLFEAAAFAGVLCWALRIRRHPLSIQRKDMRSMYLLREEIALDFESIISPENIVRG